MATERTFFALLAVLCLAASVAHAEEYPFDASLYDAEHITVELSTSSDITLAGGGTAQRLQATVSYVPEEAQSITAEPAPSSKNPLTFLWTEVRAGTYPFTFTSRVASTVQKPLITERVPYPFTSPETVTAYLAPQEISDTNSQIRNQARSLVSGKTDSLDAVWTIANWVKQNVRYDLNSVTAQASQSSSWVFRNREGVCDELTSLFLSLSREAGIPARFVSGYAYTNLEGFPDHWGPHGWAEVWLPDVGWVPVDVTYGQVGYVDATHIAIRHALDAKNTAIEYELLANALTMKPGELTTSARIISRDGEASEQLKTTLSALYSETGSRSGNVLRATIENQENYAVATDVYLASTADTDVLDPKSQGVLLPPHGTRTVSWRVQMPAYDRGYRYTVPFTAIVQRAGNASTTVEGGGSAPVYPVLPAAQPTAALQIDCGDPGALYVGENTSVTCVSPGNRLCATICSKDSLTLTFTATQPGAFPTVVKASSGSETGSAVVTFVVDQRPAPSIALSMPQSTTLGETIALSFTVNTATLTDVTVTVRSAHFSHDWTLDQLQSKGFELQVPSVYLNAGTNDVVVSVEGKDKNGNRVQKSALNTITLHATVWERIQLFFIHALG